MPRHAAWHCIIQQAALCCFISSVAAVFCHLGATRALESLRSTVNWRACIDESTARSTTSPGDVQHWWIGTETSSTGGRHTARWPAAQVYGTVSAVGRYNWRTGGRLSHGTGLCTVFVLARHYYARYLAPCKTGTGHCIAPYQSCRTEGLHTNCTCILLTDANYV